MDDDATDILSLDELMDLAAEPRPAPTQPADAPTVQLRPAAAPTQPLVAPPSYEPPPIPPAPPAPPARTNSAARTIGQDARRIGQDAQRIGHAARREGEIVWGHVLEWLKAGDNGLIAATALVTLLLLVIVGTL